MMTTIIGGVGGGGSLLLLLVIEIIIEIATRRRTSSRLHFLIRHFIVAHRRNHSTTSTFNININILFTWNFTILSTPTARTRRLRAHSPHILHRPKTHQDRFRDLLHPTEVRTRAIREQLLVS
jgi:hypothetical protein